MSNPTNPANPSGGTPGALPEKPHSGPSKGLIIGIVVIVLAIIVGLVVFFTTRKPKAAATTTVTIGVTDESQPYWAKLKELAAKENITVQTKNFASYTEVNPALRQKQLDLNQFQHLLYLANYNVQNNDNIVPLGGSMIVPLGLYSKKHTSVDQIPQGGEIAIPNDPTNEARALLVLQAAGLLKLNGGGTALSTPADIDQANSKVKVTPVDAAQTAASLPSVDGSIVNNSFAADAKLDPSKALYKDDPNSAAAEPYINVFAVRKDDLNNPTYKRVVELYHEKAVADLVVSGSNGTAVIVENKSQADLQAILDKLETQIKEKK
ncbi:MULTISPECIES: MetQ/NlpA family ABC transporter substrate-binding protein [Propionibacterium]|uniref:MetQ/NlpA family ABC transporter substrate-binding protein n=1 Tax=Propionibacterium TaxID=1743 RepID=UPI0004A035A5|nr:MetQ/NlpA family ABC transporter substrate-binding protein [Propionibacterium freudenreichii]AJQ90030.1 NLPA lipoprotein [Propionibacterium freudenreichii subsp. freudenreichii]AWY96467.1 NLPA lipoprotein [Propionibacterium freudenreichii]MCT2980759.1 methionine ABC transporter substrate-binding protein [Propionibacterium freudenreichii]MCT2984979.1 methionine ABC transporter substrate-binding protein [Propionibacterium freudenreichii]MCT2991992.1 methionine ABC transporter substrate-bindin